MAPLQGHFLRQRRGTKMGDILEQILKKKIDFLRLYNHECENIYLGHSEHHELLSNIKWTSTRSPIITPPTVHGLRIFKVCEHSHLSMS